MRGLEIIQISGRRQSGWGPGNGIGDRNSISIRGRAGTCMDERIDLNPVVLER